MLYKILINYMRIKFLHIILNRVLGRKTGRVMGFNPSDLLMEALLYFLPSLRKKHRVKTPRR